jgi:peptidoglycan/LPS O-acetylase OafA/YrhL
VKLIFLPIKKFFNTRLAIDGFFIISGLLIAKSFEASSNTKDYILRRIRRIFPAYFFIILISAFFLFLFKWKHLIIIPSLLLFTFEQYVLETQVFKAIAYGFMVFYLVYNFRFLNNFGKYGDFTYEIYIYHFPLIQVFVYFGLFYIYPPLLMFIITIILVLFLAILSWNYIELPFLPPSRKKGINKYLVKVI